MIMDLISHKIYSPFFDANMAAAQEMLKTSFCFGTALKLVTVFHSGHVCFVVLPPRRKRQGKNMKDH